MLQPMPQQHPKNKRSSWVTLASDFVKEWPEVLEGINYSNLPIRYVNFVNITLKNGVTIHYDIQTEIKKSPASRIVRTITQTLNEQYNRISKVDIKFDIPRLKKDIEQKTSKFLTKINKK